MTHRISIAPRIIFRQTFHWLKDCFPITALLNGGVTLTVLAKIAGGLGEGVRDDRDHEQRQGGQMLENISLRRKKQGQRI